MVSDTQPSLLERLRDGDDAVAWREFFDRYWRVLYVFARRQGCADHTADDMVQQVMLTVFEKRQVFRYEPQRGRFRNWLFTVLRNALVERRRKEARIGRAAGGDEPVLHAPAGEPAPDAEWEALFELNLLAAMLDVVRREVTPETYQAFELTALHGLSGAEVAELTGLSSRDAAYDARRRVVARLRQLGASYREEGQLDERLKEVLALYPTPHAERTVTKHMEATMATRQGQRHG